MRHTTDALLLRRIPYREADLVVTLFTQDLGRISAMGRGARKSQRRFSGGLEPFHTMRVVVDERLGRDLATLVECSPLRPRPSLTTNLSAMEAASRALGWVRAGSAERTPEPVVWQSTVALLDALELDTDESSTKKQVAAFGLHLLGSFGWGLELGRCTRCDRPCSPGRRATLDPRAGGIVCRECGGGTLLLDGAERARLAAAAAGDLDALSPRDTERALALVDEALRAHTGSR
jgi:DNA repair protein RecO (recombination protein O)